MLYLHSFLILVWNTQGNQEEIKCQNLCSNESEVYGGIGVKAVNIH
jgi:hypothetical protein